MMRKIREFKDESDYVIKLYQAESGKYFVKTDSKEMEITKEIYIELINKGDNYKRLESIIGTFDNEFILKEKNKDLKQRKKNN